MRGGGWGMHGGGGGMCGRGRGAYVAGEMATAADDMHPTGMHSRNCLLLDRIHADWRERIIEPEERRYNTATAQRLLHLRFSIRTSKVNIF